MDLLADLGFPILAAPWERPGNTFFFAKYLKQHGGEKARGIFNTWWAERRQPIATYLPHIADCAWSVGRLADVPPVLAAFAPLGLRETARRERMDDDGESWIGLVLRRS